MSRLRGAHAPHTVLEITEHRRSEVEQRVLEESAARGWIGSAPPQYWCRVRYTDIRGRERRATIPGVDSLGAYQEIQRRLAKSRDRQAAKQSATIKLSGDKP